MDVDSTEYITQEKYFIQDTKSLSELKIFLQISFSQ